MITVKEFLGMALYNNFNFCIYDIAKKRNIYESIDINENTDDEGCYDNNNDCEEMDEKIENLIVVSWNLNAEIHGIDINVNTET